MKANKILSVSLLVFWQCIFFSSSFAQNEYPAGKMKVIPRIPNKVSLFPLEEVHLLDSPFKRARQTDVDYLLSLKVNRLLYWYQRIAGIEPKENHYGGWENGGSNILGHYLTACSQMFAATGDIRLKQKVDSIISALTACIRISPEHTLFNDPGDPANFRKMEHDTLVFTIIGPAFPLVNGGNPWYGLHKLYAGLRDAYFYCNNEEAKKLLIQCADWANNFASHLSDDQFQQMLDVEHGGICEVMADIYAITGDSIYKKLAERFVHKKIANPIAKGIDMLYPQHANAQIPKFVGYARLYELVGKEANIQGQSAFNFWDIVLRDHTLANGGNGEYERFGPAGKISKRIGYSSSETCNTYNMLKLSKELYELTDSMKYINYYEKALYNHILAAIGPNPGMFCYYVSLKPGFFKTYSTQYNSNWCCVGTGMENPAKYGLVIYAHHKDSLFINLFIPSILNWKEKEFELKQETTFPENDTVYLKIIHSGKSNMTINIRVPIWTQNMQVFINNKVINWKETGKSYLSLQHKWKQGDEIKVIFSMQLNAESTPDNPDIAAIFYGPILLAGDFGRQGMEHVSQRVEDAWENVNAPQLKQIPMLIVDKMNLSENIHLVSNKPLTFMVETSSPTEKILLRPFYQFYKDRYSVYWDFYSKKEWEDYNKNEKQYIEDEITVGDSIQELKHDLQGEKMFTGKSFFRTFRSAKDGGWFSYKMDVKSDQPLFLVCTFWGGGWGPNPKGTFDIFVDDKKVGIQYFNESVQNHPTLFFNAVYSIPQQFTKDQKKITIRFQSHLQTINTGVFECQLTTANGLNIKQLLKNR
jgi:DUF1680 family protein